MDKEMCIETIKDLRDRGMADNRIFRSLSDRLLRDRGIKIGMTYLPTRAVNRWYTVTAMEIEYPTVNNDLLCPVIKSITTDMSDGNGWVRERGVVFEYPDLL